MFEWAGLPLFLVTSLVLIIAPGPDVIFLITQSVSRGRLAGFATALGLSAGNLFHTLAAALGVSVIFQTSAMAFTVLKIAGAIYLLYLAIKAFLSHSKSSQAPADVNRITGSSLFLRGLLMNLLNPKVALFFLAFLPQFVVPGAGPMWQQMLALGGIFTLLVVLVFGSAGIFAGFLSQKMRSNDSGKFGQYANRLVGVVYAGLAIRLLLIER